jgi:hypothetical protein
VQTSCRHRADTSADMSADTVGTSGTDETHSDEVSAGDFQPCMNKVAQALAYVQALFEFAMSRPDQFGAEQVNALQDR